MGGPKRVLAQSASKVRPSRLPLAGALASNFSPEGSWIGGPLTIGRVLGPWLHPRRCGAPRSEEHTSELQSPYDRVCRLLLEKKKDYTTVQDMRRGNQLYVTRDGISEST